MATAEKALIDFCYLKPATTRLFTTLPEVDKSKLTIEKIKKVLTGYPDSSRKNMTVSILNNDIEIRI